MSLPGNGVFVVQGEMTILMTAMRRGARWSSHSHQDEDHDILLKALQDLKALLNRVEDLKHINPNIFLEPFLEVIRSEETTGPVTSLALSSVQKFLVYGLIDLEHEGAAMAVESIASAVTRARFLGTDAAADALVLLRIIHTLRALLLSPCSHKLSDNAVCDIALSCFRICFESRLNELLRRTAELVLKDMVQLLFLRLPELNEDARIPTNLKKIKMYTNSTDPSTRLNKKKSKTYQRKVKAASSTENATENNGTVSAIREPSNLSNSSTSLNEDGNLPIDPKSLQVSQQETHLTTSPLTPNDNIVDMQGSISQNTPTSALRDADSIVPSSQQQQLQQSEQHQQQQLSATEIEKSETESLLQNDGGFELRPSSDSMISSQTSTTSITSQEYVNPRGVRFTPQSQEGPVPLVPYGIVCVRELFRFLITLCNPNDKQNNEVMIHLGLTLLTVVFEVGADSIGKYNSLLSLCKDDLCRNLFSLLSSERISIFAADLQVSFLLFESLRTHLKFQLEYYLTKLIEIIISDSIKVTYEHKEIALDNIVQLWRIPGLVTELYLNYDCDFYCTNLFEDLTKLLAKNAFPVTAGVYHTHLLSLDALLTIIESIRANCSAKLNEKKQNFDENSLENSGGGKSQQQEIVVKESTNLGFVSIASQRQKVSTNVPTYEQLNAIKTRKRWLPQGTEYFNTKPKKGIQFLQEHGILKPDLDPIEVVHFLRENPNLDKKMIGEYISSRSNLQVLEVFVNSFDFTDLRVDEALRLYLETFRLPGEAPLISMLLEYFADHWHKCNGEPFANADAAFTLAYAVIMLNVDQHNHNVKRQNTPMTPDEFKRNLKKVNGGQDFDQDMLDEIYVAIKKDEIVMPAEQTGIVRENYLWKVLLRRGNSKDGVYIHVKNGTFDEDLFNLIWGPTVAALSFVFDKSDDALIYQRAIKGFQKCAFISSQFNICTNLDTIILSLCKFTQMNSQQKQTYSATIQFASNEKSQLAFKTVLNLVHLHGDNLRESWHHILDLFLALYNHKLLPKGLLEAEDFTEATGKIMLKCETTASQKIETSLFSSLYSYMVSSSELQAPRVPSVEEQELIEYANNFIRDSNLEHVVTESKFLQMESLLHLIRALVEFSKGPDGHKSAGTGYNEHITVFFFELLLKVVIQNRDRVLTFWQSVQDHIYSLIMGAATCDYQYLLERSIIGLLRLAIRLMRNEEMSPIILQSLRMLLLLKPITLFKVSRHISFGLFELLKTSAQNIHTDSDWKIVFTLLECIGAGAHAPKLLTTTPQTGEDAVQTINDQATKSDGEAAVSSEEESVLIERGYTSDSELTKTSVSKNIDKTSTVPLTRAVSQQVNGWILVGNEPGSQLVADPNLIKPTTIPALNQSSSNIILERRLGPHNPAALLKCCESLAFLVRDITHITPYNFEDCVHCIRTFVEASMNGNRLNRKSNKDKLARNSNSKSWRHQTDEHRMNQTTASSPAHQSGSGGEDDSDDEDLPSGYHQVSIQLLDLMHTLHTRTAQIFKWWAEEHGDDTTVYSLWPKGWCPLLQGIARLCCDSRKQIRMSAITYLQRALLMPDLQNLSGPEWEACFHNVLFPLLNQLLETPTNGATEGLEEARMRAATVLSKVFLHHLTPLLTLSTFTTLWLNILDFMDKYMHAGNSDLLYEAIPESLKNMLLVMDSAKVFHDSSGEQYSPLWMNTWNRIHTFLPNLKDELFKLPEENNLENVDNTTTTVLETSSSMQGEQLYQQQTSNLTDNTTGSQLSTPLPPCPQLASPLPNVINEVSNNVSSSTRSSIILQPPVMENIASPLFSHLGQMVSTPIGVPSNVSQIVPPYSTSNYETTSKSDLTRASTTNLYSQQNFYYSTCHTGLPEPVSTQQQQPQPPLYDNTPQQQSSCLYTEYLKNPYNLTLNTASPITTTIDSNRNPEVITDYVPNNDGSGVETANNEQNGRNFYNPLTTPLPQNIFQSANYFYTDSKNLPNIPPGSEILFGSAANSTSTAQGGEP